MPAVPAAAPESADLAVVIPLLRRMEELLVNSDGAALDCVLEAQEVLARVLSAGEFAGELRRACGGRAERILLRCWRGLRHVRAIRP